MRGKSDKKGRNGRVDLMAEKNLAKRYLVRTYSSPMRLRRVGRLVATYSARTCCMHWLKWTLGPSLVPGGEVLGTIQQARGGLPDRTHSRSPPTCTRSHCVQQALTSSAWGKRWMSGIHVALVSRPVLWRDRWGGRHYPGPVCSCGKKQWWGGIHGEGPRGPLAALLQSPLLRLRPSPTVSTMVAWRSHGK